MRFGFGRLDEGESLDDDVPEDEDSDEDEEF